MHELILPQVLRAAGQPLFAIPLSQLSTAGLPPRDTADASALSNMMRNLGGSLGIALLSTVIARREVMHFSAIAEAMTANSLKVQERLQALIAGMHADPAMARARALATLASQVRREATVIAYADAFWLVGVLLLGSLATLLILRRPGRAGGAAPAH